MHLGGEKLQVTLQCKLWSGRPCLVLLEENVLFEEKKLVSSVVGGLAASRVAG